MTVASIGNSLKAIAVLLSLALLPSGCAKQNDATTRFSDSCFDVPAACGAVYSADGKYMALVSASETSPVEQVYRVKLDQPDAKPEVVSVDADGHISNGDCKNLRFVSNHDLAFDCASTNLLEGSGARSFHKSGDAPLEAYSSL
jgi:hypothetical protein